MPIFRKVFGPFHPETEMFSGRVEKLRWSFIVIRDDFTLSHYTLVYSAEKNTYTSVNGDQDESSLGPRVRSMGNQVYGSRTKVPVEHPNMFIEGDDSPVLQGATITEILKSRLPAEEVAKITAVRIARRA